MISLTHASLSMPTSTSHAISRSAELLSVAKTSLRILQQNPEESLLHPELQTLNPNDLALHNTQYKPSNAAMDALEEASLTLNLLNSTLKTLSDLVKRRGTTNDPTEEINKAISSFHSFSKGILEVIQNALPQSAVLSPYDDVVVRATTHRVKHYEIVAKELQANVEKINHEFKSIMTLRGDVIKEQALRRKKLLNAKTPAGNANAIENGGLSLSNGKAGIPLAPKSGGVRIRQGFAPNSNSMAKSQMNSPLFTMQPAQAKPKAKPIPPPMMRHRNQIGASAGVGASVGAAAGANGIAKVAPNPYSQITAPNPYGAAPKSGYGGGGATNGYGGGYGYGGSNTNTITNTNTGMRRRGAGPPTNNGNNGFNPHQEDENKVHDSNSVQAQIQMRRENRQTQNRLDSARQAEKSLAELTTMFSKMTNLIHSQGETLVKIEDDVEAAMDHVEAGRDEIVKLYEWTQGNRGLIIKIFALLIFFIIFMKFYG